MSTMSETKDYTSLTNTFDNDPSLALIFAPGTASLCSTRRAPQPEHFSGKPLLWSIHSIEEETEVTKVGKKRAISKKSKRRRTTPISDDEESPYNGISIEEIWAHPEKPDDVKHCKSHVHTLENRSIKTLADITMEMIEKEHLYNRQVSRFANIVQQDDPLYQDLKFEDEIPNDVLKPLREVMQDNISCSLEFIGRLTAIRQKLLATYKKKSELRKKLLSGDNASSNCTSNATNTPTATSPS
ncbi:hypothetical protein HK102_001127 [Quaeritorhiza haematococci]|nr:hypothetical protein HK102_001127 [Quaeritorhiza haematococci]